MATIGRNVAPDFSLSAAANVERARSDIKEVFGLLRLVTLRESSDTKSSACSASSSTTRLWSELVDEEEGEPDALAASQSKLVDKGLSERTSACTQTGVDLSSTVVVSGESALIEFVRERTCSKVLDELFGVMSGWRHEFAESGDGNDDVASTVIASQPFDVCDFDALGGDTSLLNLEMVTMMWQVLSSPASLLMSATFDALGLLKTYF